MKICRTVVLGSLLLAGTALLNNTFAQQKDNTLTKKEEKQGWQLLFDGTSTNGWHSFNKPQIGSAWNVENDAFHLGKKEDRDAGGDAITNEVFGDFELKLDWKISPNGNSGIMFLVKEDPKYDYDF